jgi:hypothetical protein
MTQEHGSYDESRQEWFCGYWMSKDEWFDIHDYAPATQKEMPDSDTLEE